MRCRERASKQETYLVPPLLMKSFILKLARRALEIFMPRFHALLTSEAARKSSKSKLRRIFSKSSTGKAKEPKMGWWYRRPESDGEDMAEEERGWA